MFTIIIFNEKNFNLMPISTSFEQFSSFCTYIMASCLIFSVVSCAAAVRKEIADETDRETGGGRSKQISSVPIYLSIYSPNGEIGLRSYTTKICFMN